MIAIIDYGAGNLMSVKKAFDFLGEACKITNDVKEIEMADRVVLPGVGSFGAAMRLFNERGLVPAVKEAAGGKKPFLGICLGLQLLFEGSEESSGVKGISVFKGQISAIPKETGLKVPHIGWNSVSLKQTDGIFKDIPDESYFYFVHSFYLHGAEESTLAATTEYGVKIECAVQRGLTAATQFHPEKSGEVGLQVLRNFAKLG